MSCSDSAAVGYYRHGLVFSFDPTHGSHYRHGELHIVVSREFEPMLRTRLD